MGCKKTTIRCALAVAFLVLAGSATATLLYRGRMKHFACVAQGSLYRSGLLTSGQMEDVLRRYKIRTVVNLIPLDREGSRSALLEEKRLCRAHGVDWLSLEIAANAPPSPQVVDSWLDLLDEPSRHPILVHCKHGVVRTGEMVALYQIEVLGWKAEKAIEWMPRYGHQFENHKRRAILDFLRGYVPPGRAVRGGHSKSVGPARGAR